ncbi:MAG: ATP-binding region ATPase domain protein [Deltaproteobacteria bacterium]|nr:ATP-binding region ATPase domain protein [Deltaproteobacteria bacterium]
MKRRLIGPTIVTLVLTGLVADHLFFSQSPWSVVNFLVKVVTILGAIFKPVLDPKNLAWLDDLLVPVTMVALAFILLWLAVARAKRAMSQATPDAESFVPLAEQAQLSEIRQAIESLTGGELETKQPPQFPLIRKLACGFSAIGIVFGVAAYVIVFVHFSRVYEKELVSRAQVTTIALTDLVRHRQATKSANEIADDVKKYAAIKAVAYVYVEDAKGAIIAHTPKDLPRHLNRDFPKSAERAVDGVNVQYRGQGVFEVANRIGTGNSGFVHLGIWRDALGVEMRIALFPIAVSIVVLLLGITGLFIVIARCLNRPLFDLVEQADRISRGDFSVALSLKRTDEIGDIARSIERMRASLHAVVRRLEQEESTEQPDKLPARSDR